MDAPAKYKPLATKKDYEDVRDRVVKFQDERFVEIALDHFLQCDKAEQVKTMLDFFHRDVEQETRCGSEQEEDSGSLRDVIASLNQDRTLFPIGQWQLGETTGPTVVIKAFIRGW